MEWQKIDNSLKKTFVFKNFTEAFTFMTEIAFESEKMSHHPNWSNVWNKVSIELSTHDAGNIVTNKDLELAEKIDEIYKRFS